jgi:DNA polymerase-3 subunit delta'
MLILIAPSADSVMPTLKSRCQVMKFGTVPSAEISVALVGEGIPRDQAELFARLSGGRPGAAMALARDPLLFRAMREARESVLRLFAGGVPERFEEITRALPPKLPFRESADRAETLLDMATEILHDAFLAAAGQEQSVMHLDVYDRVAALVNGQPGLAGVLAALEEVEPSKKMLKENVSPKTVLERFALSF